MQTETNGRSTPKSPQQPDKLLDISVSTGWESVWDDLIPKAFAMMILPVQLPQTRGRWFLPPALSREGQWMTLLQKYKTPDGEKRRLL
jgi:hypothetical protein